MSTLRAYLQLVRIPAVFTALADIALGFLLVRRGIDGAETDLVLLLTASGCLYMSGMVFNDVFDRRQDAAERPERPLPSGRITVRSAVIFGCCLIAVGLVAAALAHVNSLTVALLLTACILGYDSVLKRTPLGPPAMGTCRLLNVILGASSAGLRWTAPWHFPQIWIAASLGIYVAGVTWFARREAQQSSSRSLAGAAVLVNLGLAGLMLLAYDRFALNVSWSGAPDATYKSVALLGFIAVTINSRIVRAIINPSPSHVQAAVRLMLLSIITIDATLIFFKLGDAGVVYAGTTAALLLPAMLLGRWVYAT